MIQSFESMAILRLRKWGVNMEDDWNTLHYHLLAVPLPGFRFFRENSDEAHVFFIQFRFIEAKTQ